MDEAVRARKGGQAWVKPWWGWDDDRSTREGGGEAGSQGREQMSAPGKGLSLKVDGKTAGQAAHLGWRGAWGPALGLHSRRCSWSHFMPEDLSSFRKGIVSFQPL